MDGNAFFKIGYGLYVVTSQDAAGRDNGMICNAVVQVTAKPPRIAVAINKQNHSHDNILVTRRMNVCVLSEAAPFAIFERFGFKSGRDTNKFEGYGFTRGANGVAQLGDDVCNAVFELDVVDYLDYGTHGLFICDVAEARELSSVPTMTYAYYQDNVKPKAAAVTPAAPGEKRKWVCKICGYVYDPAENNGVDFEDLPADWTCPWCKHTKEDFEPVG